MALLKARRRLASIAGAVSIGAIAVFLLAPIVVVVIGSFSDRAYMVFPPQGFSLRWYAQFFGSHEFMTSTFVSIRLGTSTMLVARGLGVFAALGSPTIGRRRRSW